MPVGQYVNNVRCLSVDANSFFNIYRNCPYIPAAVSKISTQMRKSSLCDTTEVIMYSNAVSVN